MIFRQRRLILAVLLALWAAAIGAAPAGAAAPTPSAALLERQWALGMVNAPCAWRITAGSPDVTVAVLDTGVDMTHPALVGRLRADGYDFADGDDDPSDTDGHGTHVAGIIAATLVDAEGVSGLAPGVSILPVRVLSNDGGSDPDIAAGIRYAADQGARVINLSLGASLLLAADETSPQLDSAIAYAERAGALIVIAAGNDYLPLPNVVGYQNENVVVVAASNREDRRARFSNYGAWVTVAAPGEDILSTMPTYDVFATSEGPPEYRLNKNYDVMSGTSMASPYVAALAALIFSAAPDATPQEVRAIIQRSADEAIYATAPTNVQRLRQLGAGRIDACAALQAIDAPAAAAPTAPAATATRGAPAPPTRTPAPARSPTAQPTAAPPGTAVILLPTIVVQQPTIPGLPTATPGRGPSPQPRPTRPAAPAPEDPTDTVEAFLTALRDGDLQRAQALAAPARLGGTVQIDLSSFIDIKDYIDRMESIVYSAPHGEGPTATVAVGYRLVPAGGGAPETTGGTFTLIRDGGGWYIQRFALPGLAT